MDGASERRYGDIALSFWSADILTINTHHQHSPSALTISTHHQHSPSTLTINTHHQHSPSTLTINTHHHPTSRKHFLEYLLPPHRYTTVIHRNVNTANHSPGGPTHGTAAMKDHLEPERSVGRNLLSW
ncbi:hypothetical protein E8E15_000097 [Penicillium rubens]|nr:hypothetical protein E8E15_000097 [Penicillium rubens]